MIYVILQSPRPFPKADESNLLIECMHVVGFIFSDFPHPHPLLICEAAAHLTVNQ